MSDEIQAEDEIRTRAIDIDADAIVVRSESQREIDVRLVPWNVEIDTMQGLEEFQRGAFDGLTADDVELMGLEHQVTFGLDQAGNVKPVREEVGFATRLEDREDGEYATFRIYNTGSGDEVYQRIVAGRRRKASLEFAPEKGGVRYVRTASGRSKGIITRLAKANAAIVRRGAYAAAEVVAVRTDQEVAPVAEDTAAPEATTDAPAAEIPTQIQTTTTLPPVSDEAYRSFASVIEGFGTKMTNLSERLTERVGALEERARSQFVVPGASAGPEIKVSQGDWLQYALRAMSGERISREDQQYRAVEDVITSDNLGVVPDAFLQGEMIGAIDSSRPFMSSTRRLPTPRGMTLHVPKIEQRPLVDLQSEEKTELASRAIKVTTADFAAKTKGGVIDISLQLLKQSEPAFLDLALRLMFEAYAQETELEALQELTGETDFNDAGNLNVSTPLFGEAFINAFTDQRVAPDTIWVSSKGLGAMMDATAGTSGLPRYPNIVVGGGANGSVSGLRVVHAPAMDEVGVDVIVGPSSGFAWAESGAYNLQVDVPARAGRDVSIVGIVWFAPYYPGAFTGYTIS